MKIIFLGSAGIGKTTFINRCYDEELVKIPDVYRPTIGSRSLKIKDIELIEYGGQSILNQTIKKADLYVIMFNKNSKTSYKQLEFYYKMIKNIDSDPDILICGLDHGIKKIQNKDILFHRKYDLQYCNQENLTHYIDIKVQRFRDKHTNNILSSL